MILAFGGAIMTKEALLFRIDTRRDLTESDRQALVAAVLEGFTCGNFEAEDSRYAWVSPTEPLPPADDGRFDPQPCRTLVFPTVEDHPEGLLEHVGRQDVRTRAGAERPPIGSPGLGDPSLVSAPAIAPLEQNDFAS
jgi:hypothetical protein